ncbi:MAG: twin-arginine translocase subunit TatB [Rhodobacteraceae bacterium]|nr:twin-arginine translocase subunit TatB [Paracoccaceae bacterium]
MFDIGMTELLVIGVVALIVVGPKDLPGMFRTLGKFTARARAMAREFQRSMEDAADEAGIKDVAKDLKSATSLRNLGLDHLKDAAKDYTDPVYDAEASKKKIEAAKKIEADKKAAAALAAAGENTRALAEKRTATKAAALEKAASKAAKPKSDKPAAKKPVAKKPVAKKPADKAAAETATKPATKPRAKASK